MNCPTCKGPLERVRYPGGYLNKDQWDAVRAGDWWCETCPDNGRGRNGGHYWWTSELPDVHAKPFPEPAYLGSGCYSQAIPQAALSLTKIDPPLTDEQFRAGLLEARRIIRDPAFKDLAIRALDKVEHDLR